MLEMESEEVVMRGEFPLPDFNERGLLPPGFHPARFDAFRQKFGFNPERLEMIDNGLRNVSDELRLRGVQRIFVGGSFVTEKPSPEDIDMYVPVPDVQSALFWFTGHRSRLWLRIYRVHCFPAIQGSTGPGSEAYWQDWFAHEEDGTPKGIVALNL